jgi:hypothetical protein
MFGRLNGHARGEIDVSLDKLANIILVARAYEAGIGDERSGEVSPGSSSYSSDGSKERAARDLRDAIDALSEDEQAVLVALSSIGRGDFGAQEFDRALTMVFDRRGCFASDYIVGLPKISELLEDVAAAWGADLEDARQHAINKPNGAAH